MLYEFAVHGGGIVGVWGYEKPSQKTCIFSQSWRWPIPPNIAPPNVSKRLVVVK
ncbi:dihydroneopterin aldolase [Acetobacter orientalis]|uniref:Dihydroneopterin aldolase n=1 Tax=Acetobacter orientalis TaxID=146474 RepID=A0A2Z5ZL35_9PROT|nr:dihydroneopterin aldolase [Acetobacter orientalis]